MKKVLIGATRSKGSIPTEDKKEIVFDNIVLSFADYQGPNAYFQLAKESDRVKIRISDFDDITGVKPGVFLSHQLVAAAGQAGGAENPAAALPSDGLQPKAHHHCRKQPGGGDVSAESAR